jgi:uncharacterized protein (DUF362 family)
MAIVSVDTMMDDMGGLREQFVTAFDAVGLAAEYDRSHAIFVKPNLTYPTFKEGVTTRGVFISCLVAALRSINRTTKIYIGEGEGGYNSFSMTSAMRDMGFYDIGSSYPNVEIVNLSQLATRKVELKANGKPYALHVPELFFDGEIDFSITCPVPKVHCMTGVSLSFKNQWGCVPDAMRLRNHYVFDEIIGQICEILKFRYAFLDGKYGLDKNGPMMGDPVEVGWFVASNSLGAFDRTVSSMMGFDWRRIGHLRKAYKYGFMPSADEIVILGDPDALKRRFTLKRNMWNYPALAGFHSKHLTHLFYFSMWANVLHDIMYSFRKRSISK